MSASRRVPGVSVVIPTYNYGRFLAECLESIRHQEGVDLEIVVVDDGSQDDTAEACARLSEVEPRLRVVRHDVNRGHIATFNHALDEATRDYVVKLDADDCLTPGSLARSADLLESHPDAAFVYGRPQVFTGAAPGADELRRLARRTRWRVWSGQDWITARLRRGHNPIKQPEVMIRRSALVEVGGHRPEVPASSDLNLWLRLASVGDVGRINGPIQGLYRMHDTNMHDTMHGGVMADVRARWDAMSLFVAESEPVGARPGRASLLQRTFARDTTRLAEELCDMGRAPSEEVEAVLRFAESLHPSITERRRHAAVRRRLAPERGREDAPWSLVARARRDIESRVRWQQWDRYGW